MLARFEVILVKGAEMYVVLGTVLWGFFFPKQKYYLNMSYFFILILAIIVTGKPWTFVYLNFITAL